MTKPRRDPRLFLDDILESIDLILDYTKNIDYVDFESRRDLQDSILRRIEIIGEAVKQLPQTVRKEYPHIPWKDIAGTRDFLIHEYFRVNLILTWRVATVEIIKLRRQIVKIMKEMDR